MLRSRGQGDLRNSAVLSSPSGPIVLEREPTAAKWALEPLAKKTFNPKQLFPPEDIIEKSMAYSVNGISKHKEITPPPPLKKE